MRDPINKLVWMMLGIGYLVAVIYNENLLQFKILLMGLLLLMGSAVDRLTAIRNILNEGNERVKKRGG